MFPLGLPVLVAVLTTQPPVHIQTVDISHPIRELNIGTDVGTTVSGDYGFHVRFTNDADQPVKRIVFALNDGTTIVDAGTFSPGVTIDHSFKLDFDDADSCRVESVTFADGTRWTPDPDLRG